MIRQAIFGLLLLLAAALPAQAQMLMMGFGPGSTGGGGASNATGFTASGPSSGTAGSASSNFTVTAVGGTFTGSQTITIADGSSGGTITPSVGSPGTSTVTVTPTAASSSFTFTYTAALGDSISLVFTNGQSWSNPSSLPYLGAVTYTASGPSTGTVLVASTNFTVSMPASTKFSGTDTVTIADGSSGGTITPSVGSPGTSTVTVTPAANATSFTFTYTAATAAAFTLTLTNAQSWTNPAALPFTASATFVGACNAGVGTFKAYYGVRKCAAAYAGNGMTIKRTSDNVTCPLGYLANGLLDVSTGTSCTGSTTATQFCNATTCNITILNDTSGNNSCTGSTACDYTFSTITTITLQFNCTGSIPCIQAASSTQVNTANQTSAAAQPYTLTHVFTRTANFTSTQGLMQTSASGTAISEAFSAANTFGFYAGTATQQAAVNIDSGYHAVTLIANAASSTFKVDSAAPVTMAGTPGTGTFGNIKLLSANPGATVRVLELGLASGGMTSGNQTTLYNNQSAFYGSIF